ncbi:DUF6382 domain-containing protein [Gorillibacterium sp. sgz500922]|uniref:DUF6382 domain-containing protein n=1 Tax=Gorillibacterium sp. sgz500922 TaxID=3446694 RepID=UPI003F680D02
MNELHGLIWDQVERNGHSLVLRQAERPLTAADLNSTERKMLELSPIQGLLPFSAEEQDLEIALFYNYTAKRPLSQELRFHPLRADEMARLLIDIVFILDHSLAYLLQAHRFVLEPDHIYADGEIRSLELVYLPLSRMDGEPDLTTRWNRLVRSLISISGELEGPIAKALHGLLEREAPPAEYKQKLLAALQASRMAESAGLTDSAGAPEPGVLREMSQAGTNSESASLHQSRRPAGIAASPVFDPSRSPESGKLHPAPAGSEEKPPASGKTPASGKGDPGSSPSETPSRAKLSDRTLLTLALPLLAGWGAYAWLLSETALYIAAGLTVFVASVGYHLMRKPQSAEANEAFEAANSPVRPGNRILQPSPAVFTTPLTPPALHPEIDSDLSERTVLLSDPNATVLLKKPAAIAEAEPDPFLESKEGERQSIRLSIPDKGLLIGRDSPEWPAASGELRELSRQHCEVIRTGRDCFIRDLGSKNGTQLNGTALIPFKEYPLTQGDCLELAGIVLFFRG